MNLDPYARLPHPGETTLIEIRPSVAIVGAGMAGVTAARLLAQRGFPVTLFEKARGLGGRMSTRREGDYAFDHGCQFFTARDERFRRYLEAWVEQGLASRWDLRVASCERGGVTPLRDETLRYVGVPGMNAMIKKMAEGLDVRLSTMVTGLQQDDGAWRVISEPAGTDETFEIVIVTAPAEQAVPLLAGAPLLQAQAAGVRMQPCWALMAAFEFDLEPAFDGAFLRGSPLVWVANNGSKPGRTSHECWVMHAAPSWSREHLDLPPEEIVAHLLPAFFDAVGLKPVKPLAAYAHRWRYASPETALQGGCLWDARTGLAACGDWCHSARLENAFLSGLILAERIMAERPRARVG